MGKPLDSPASFRHISLTSCVSKLFERIILSRLLFFLKSNSILSLHHADFRRRRTTLDQILFLAQSGFNKPRPGSRTILATIDFSKAFDSVWHPALFHQLILAGLPSCCCYPILFEWGHGGKPWSPRSRATPQGLDQKSEILSLVKKYSSYKHH